MKHIFKIYIDNFDIEFEYSGNHYRLSWDHYGVLIFCNFGIWNVAKNRCKKLKVYPSAVFYHEYLHIIWFIRRLHCLDCILYIYWERLSSLTDELWKWTVIVARLVGEKRVYLDFIISSIVDTQLEFLHFTLNASLVLFFFLFS